MGCQVVFFQEAQFLEACFQNCDSTSVVPKCFPKFAFTSSILEVHRLKRDFRKAWLNNVISTMVAFRSMAFENAIYFKKFDFKKFGFERCELNWPELGKTKKLILWLAKLNLYFQTKFIFSGLDQPFIAADRPQFNQKHFLNGRPPVNYSISCPISSAPLPVDYPMNSAPPHTTQLREGLSNTTRGQNSLILAFHKKIELI